MDSSAAGGGFLDNIEFLRELDPDIASAYARIFDDGAAAAALPETERALILFGMSTVHGREADVRTCGDRAVRSGASPEAVLETALAASISQGVRALSNSRGFLSELKFDWQRGGVLTQTEAASYLEGEFGDLPDWARSLARFSPEFLADYASIRMRLLREGAARRRTKELLTMALNAIAGNRGGIVAHATAALRHGAEPAHLLDTLILAVCPGGIVAWIVGIDAIGHLVPSVDAD